MMISLSWSGYARIGAEQNTSLSLSSAICSCCLHEKSTSLCVSLCKGLQMIEKPFMNRL